ncbi:hypothetical protein [Paenibacillus sp. HB172176]|uniref:hypothetical protein n=1 Tax=Paenibacillus sp. HB172176 TaxID=2493690 RepID=UPI00143AA95A|nr:hypothetical protein [Paenibacillus sp. HB172176]
MKPPFDFDYVYPIDHHNSNTFFQDVVQFLFKKKTEPALFSVLDTEESADRDKIVLGDFINVDYELSDIHITAKIIGMSTDYEGDTISLTISNVSKNLLFQDKQVAQIKSAISTSNSFAANKYAYDNNIERTDEVSQILNTTWSAIDRQIEGGLNNSISMSRRGIIVSDSNDPSKMLIIQNGVLAISSDSGKHWRTAVTNRGIIAERIVGQLIAGNDLTVTNQSGSFTIDDNGMTATEMDLVITRTESDGSIKSRVLINATHGLKIQKNTGTTSSPVWSDQIVLDTNGDVIFKGKVEIGSGNSLFKADSNGISLGSSTFANAPFSVDLTGKMKASNVQVTGGTMQIGSKFGVASDGTLTANNANISGNINMNGGSISWGSVPKPSYSASEVGALSSSSERLTYISPSGIYTGTLDADKIVSGTISADRITTNIQQVNGTLRLGNLYDFSSKVSVKSSTHQDTILDMGIGMEAK